MSDALQRARLYVAKIAAAISGQNGHGQTFSVAISLVHGFALDEHSAFTILSEYNSRCVPPWSEAELRHKIQSAMNTDHKGERGHLLGQKTHFVSKGCSTSTSSNKTAGNRQSATTKARKYKLEEDAILPEPIVDGCRKFIAALFSPGEGVGIASEIVNESDQRGIPRDAGSTLSQEEWLRRLDAVNGDPNLIFSSSQRTGAFIRINPLKIGGTSDSAVTDFRIALLEFDSMSTSEQWSLIQQSNIPCEAILFSGRKSLHAWVRVQAASKDEYADRVKVLYGFFHEYGLDEKNKNPSRFSRLPGMVRGNNKQELLCLKCGAESWDEWTSSQVDLGLPPILSATRMFELEMIEPMELIKGILHIGSKLVLGGGSKSYKTFALIDLAISIACGAPWWNCETIKQRVLYINFEIQEFFFRQRVKNICDAKQVNLDGSMLDAWNLRGYCASLDKLIPKIISGIKSKTYGLIVLDPIYKALGNRDENKAGEMADLLNNVEHLAVESGAAAAFGAHFSKGNQSDKVAIDRIGGSGVFARDPDAILTMTPHEESDCLTVDFKLRNLPPKESIVVKWEWPLFRRDLGKDPSKLAKAKGRKTGYSDDKIVAILTKILEKTALDDKNAKSHYAVSGETFRKQAETKTGISRSQFYKRLSELLETGKIHEDTDGEYYVKNDTKS